MRNGPRSLPNAGAAACLTHNDVNSIVINRGTMYKAIRRLRTLACEIPESSAQTHALDLTAPKGPVEIHAVNQPDSIPGGPAMREVSLPHTDNSHMIEIVIGPAAIKVPNGSDPSLLRTGIEAAGRIYYAG